MKKPPNTDSSQHSDDLERKVIEALWRNGLVIPLTTEQMVDYLASLDALPFNIPESIADCESAINRILGDPITLKHIHPINPDTEQLQSLRRAARNGQRITPEVEESMRQARHDSDDNDKDRSA